MASIANRSSYQVSVKNRPDLTKRFPFTRKVEARAYPEALRSEGFKALLAQNENKLLVRIRTRSHEDVRQHSPRCSKGTSKKNARNTFTRLLGRKSDQCESFFDHARACDADWYCRHWIKLQMRKTPGASNGP